MAAQAVSAMTRAQLASLVKLLFVTEHDILRLSQGDRATLYSFVNEAAAQHGFASWMDAYYSMPEVQR